MALSKWYDQIDSLGAEDYYMVFAIDRIPKNDSGKTGLEEYLRATGKLACRNVGTSMLPMLKQGRDVFTVSAYRGGKLKKYDVVLFKRKSGEYILHRIVKTPDDGTYVLMGDNCCYKESGIRKEDILGVMISFDHRGRTISTDSALYKFYSRIWCYFSPFRIFIRRSYLFLKRRFKGIMKR